MVNSGSQRSKQHAPPIVQFVDRQLSAGESYLHVKQIALSKFGATIFDTHKAAIMRVLRSHVPANLAAGPLPISQLKVDLTPQPEDNNAIGAIAVEEAGSSSSDDDGIDLGNSSEEDAETIGVQELSLHGVKTKANLLPGYLVGAEFERQRQSAASERPESECIHINGHAHRTVHRKRHEEKHCSNCLSKFSLTGSKRPTSCRNCGDAVCFSCSTKSYWAMLSPTPQRTCEQCLVRLQKKHEDFNGHSKRLPILIVPGFASSALEVRESKLMKKWEGERVWVSVEMLFEKLFGGGQLPKDDDDDDDDDEDDDDDDVGVKVRSMKSAPSSRTENKAPPMADDANGKSLKSRESFVVMKDSTQHAIDTGNALVRHLTLQQNGFSDPNGIVVRAAKGLAAVSWLSEFSRSKSYVFGYMVEHLVGLGYVRNDKANAMSPKPGLAINQPRIDAMPYDWRIAPSHLQERDNYFSELKKKVEELYEAQGGRPVILLSHSMGSKMVYYFLRWVLWQELEIMVRAKVAFVPALDDDNLSSNRNDAPSSAPARGGKPCPPSRKRSQASSRGGPNRSGSANNARGKSGAASRHIFPFLQRAHIGRAQILAKKLGIKIPSFIIDIIKHQEDRWFSKNLTKRQENGEKLVEDGFRHNLDTLVSALMPKILELHGGMPSRWARKYVKQFVSLGGPFLGSARGVRLSCAGTAMGLERFFNAAETSQLTHTCAAAAFLYPVPRALYAVNAVAAVQSHPGSSVDPNYDYAKDEVWLRKTMIPWYKHNDVVVGGATAARDFVMEEVYRLVSTCRLVQNGEEIVAAHAEEAAAAAASRSSSAMSGLLPSSAKTVRAGHGPQQQLLSLSQLATKVTEKFGFAAYLNRQTKIRTIFDEYLKQAQNKPSSLPVFLVRNESVIRVTVSNVWLNKAFQYIVKPRLSPQTRENMDWYMVLTLRYAAKGGSRHKAKSKPTRIQTVDEFTRSKFMKRVQEILRADALSPDDKAPAMNRLKGELLKTFPLGVYKRFEEHLKQVLHGVSKSDKPFEALTANQGRAATARLPLNASESTFGGVNLAMEVRSDVHDFLEAHHNWKYRYEISRNGKASGAKVKETAHTFENLRKAQLQLAVFAFADEKEAQHFCDVDGAIGSGVKMAAVNVEVGPLLQVQEQHAGAHEDNEVFNIFNGWCSVPHHAGFPLKKMSDELAGVQEVVRRSSMAPSKIDGVRHLSSFTTFFVQIIRIQRLFRAILNKRRRRATRFEGHSQQPPGSGKSKSKNFSSSRSTKSSVNFHTNMVVVDRTDSNARMKSQLSVKLGSAKYTTPPLANCSLHLQVQWRRHAFKVPTSTRVCPDLDFGTAVSEASNPLGPVERQLKRRGGKKRKGHFRTASGRFFNAVAAGGGLDGRGAANGQAGADVVQDGTIPDHILKRTFGPHPLRNKQSGKKGHKSREYIGVPASAILNCQGAENNVGFWDYYKRDPLLYDEATRVEGHCFTCPPACDNMLQLYGINLPTERHAFYKRRKCIRTNEVKHTALVPDDDAEMETMFCKGGLAFETKDTKQVRSDTGDLVFGCGDGTVHYQSLRFPAVWRRSVIWRQQRRHMLNSHLTGTLYEPSDVMSPEDEKACDVRLKEFDGLEHRQMLNSAEVKDTLTSVVSNTLQIRMMRLHDFWPRILAMRDPGRKLKSLQAYWEVSLLPKDAKNESSLFSGKTSEKILYAASSSPKRRVDQHHVIASEPLLGDEHVGIVCSWEDTIRFDPSIDLSEFVGVCCKLRFSHGPNRIIGFFTLSSAQINQHNSKRLRVTLSDDCGVAELECHLHMSGELGEESVVMTSSNVGQERGFDPSSFDV